MIDKLNKHRTEGNANIVDQLKSIIVCYKLSTYNDLKNFEELFFTVDGKTIKKEKRIAYVSNNIIRSFSDYDDLEDEMIDVVHKLKQSLFTDIKDEEKLFNIIKLYGILEQQCPFLTEAYNLIIQNKYL